MAGDMSSVPTLGLGLLNWSCTAPIRAATKVVPRERPSSESALMLLLSCTESWTNKTLDCVLDELEMMGVDESRR